MIEIKIAKISLMRMDRIQRNDRKRRERKTELKMKMKINI
jgi:hypothetical protein